MKRRSTSLAESTIHNARREILDVVQLALETDPVRWRAVRSRILAAFGRDGLGAFVVDCDEAVELQIPPAEASH